VSPTRVLIVDDSALVRGVLRAALEADPAFEVVGEASDGTRAVTQVAALRPDVVTMDVLMPLMGGLEAIDRIMAGRDGARPTPIVVVADTAGDADTLAMDALERGAVEVFPKPRRGFQEDEQRRLRRVLRHAASVRPQRMAPARPVGPRSTAPPRQGPRGEPRSRRPAGPALGLRHPVEVIGIVGSTGAPGVLRALVAELPATFPVPIAVVQHTARGFTDALAHWLDQTTALRVRVAGRRQRLAPGTIHIAPDDRHLRVGPRGELVLGDDPRVDGHRPSGTALLRSLADSFGPGALGIVLTGMGRDGAEGAQAIARAGGAVLVQSPETATVGGMPRAALAAAPGAAVGDVEWLGGALARLGTAAFR